MASVVYECPRGVFTRIMEGSHGWELYQEWRKHPNVGGTKQAPKGKALLDIHMNELHNVHLKQTGLAR